MTGIGIWGEGRFRQCSGGISWVRDLTHREEGLEGRPF